MTHTETAELHNQIVETLGGKYKISTPGVSRGNFEWMDVSHLPRLPRIYNLCFVGLASGLRASGRMRVRFCRVPLLWQGRPGYDFRHQGQSLPTPTQ